MKNEHFTVCTLRRFLEQEHSCHYQIIESDLSYEIFGYSIYRTDGTPMQMYRAPLNITNQKLVTEKLKQVQLTSEIRLQEQTRELIAVNEHLQQELTAQVSVEQALRKSEEQLQLALLGSGDGWWDWNVITKEAYFSPRWFEMLGYTPNELPGHISTWEQLIHPDDQPLVMKTLDLHLQDVSHPFIFDYRMMTKSGQWKWITNCGKVVVCDALGNPVRMAGTHRDISNRKHIEEQLKLLNAQLEKSNQELQSFALAASHDLKEPLRTIQSFCNLLQKRYGKLLDERGLEYIERMHNSVQQMQSLIDNLLALSQVTTKVQQFAPVDLNQVIQNVLSSLEIKIQETQAQIEVGNFPVIEADFDQLYQLMQNLISNALKFHGQKPPILKISCKVIPQFSPEYLTDNSVCQIFVEDQGIGFEEKYLERIFHLFERLHSRSEYEGSGVGLALCRKIIERHSGHITAKSLPGKGSTFIVTLPIKQIKIFDHSPL